MKLHKLTTALAFEQHAEEVGSVTWSLVAPAFITSCLKMMKAIASALPLPSLSYLPITVSFAPAKSRISCRRRC